MSLRRLLPTLDNAGRRLVLAEVLGQPVSMRHARRRGRSRLPDQLDTPIAPSTGVMPEASELPKVLPLIGRPSTQETTEETAVVDMRSLIEASEEAQASEDLKEVRITREEDHDD